MTFETFDQSDEETWPDKKNYDKYRDKDNDKDNDEDKYIEEHIQRAISETCGL